MKKLFVLFLLGFGVVSLSACDFIQDYLDVEPTNEQIIIEDTIQAQLMTTRTHIRATNIGVQVDLFNLIAGRFERMAGTSRGSGVIFAYQDGHYYALTNFHVIDPQDYARAAYTVMPGYLDEGFDAEVIFYDESKDLALLRFAAPEGLLPLMDVTTREFSPLGDDEFVLAVGNPSALTSLVTFGEFIRLARVADVDFPVILHSALIFPGNSGGALTDLDGYLVGINTWTSRNDDERNLAVPLNEVLAFIRAFDEGLIP